MKITIDLAANQLISEEGTCVLYSDEGFDRLSALWLKVGWNARYHYTFSWLGRPILQLPSDLLRLQEIIFEVQPEMIIETGIALGGSLLFYATLCHANGKGRVIGIDSALRPPSRKAIEAHPLSSLITLIEGDSTSPQTISQLPKEVKGLVILDANHSKNHVSKELELYHPFVAEGSYLIVADGIKKNLSDTPRGKAKWVWDNPADATLAFVKKHPAFQLVTPPRRYSRSGTAEVSHFLHGWLQKKAAPHTTEASP